MKGGFHSLFSVVHRPAFVSRWGPVLVWIAGIFYFSSRSYPLGPVSRSEHAVSVSNIAHVLEYAGLAILLHRAVAGSGKGQKTPASAVSSDLPVANNPGTTTLSSQESFFVDHLPLVTFAIALACAISDELYQERIPSRGFELADLKYDLAGVVVALVLIRIRACIEQRDSSRPLETQRRSTSLHPDSK